MEHKKFVEVPATEASTKEVHSHNSCDICGAEVSMSGLGDVDMEFRDMECSYPECGSGTRYIYDICDKCFSEKVMPMMRELGAKPRTEEIEW